MNKPRFSCLFFLALSLVDLGIRAEESVAIASVLSSGVADPMVMSARQNLKDGQWRQARRSLKKYLDANENSPEGWTLLGRTYLMAGAYGKALRRFNKALQFDPHYSPAFDGRGEVFEKKGRMDEALNEYRAAALSDPNDPVAGQSVARLTAVSSSGPKAP